MIYNHYYFRLLHLAIIILPFLSGCTSTASLQNKPLASGNWRFTFDLNGDLLPVNAILSYSDNGQAIFDFKNASEIVSAPEVAFNQDSVIIKMPYFNTSLHLLKESDDLLTGSFINHDKQNYSIPVHAEFNKDFRFTPTVSSQLIGDRYKVIFTQPSDETYNAILQIRNEQGHLTGTFRTETGDYRFLQGNIMNGKINLSTFDGAHLFYFDAQIKGDSLTNGRFLSGNHYRSTWIAVTDTVFELQNPESITYLKNTNDTIDFRLFNQDGDSVRWSDLDLDNKVVILDIMGSWCPNCLDANKALYSIIEKYPDSKVSLIPISFEHASNFEIAKPLIERSLDKNGEHSTFLFGGKATKQQASSVFPMLNAISSFPTIIIIDRNRKVQLIYTGFNGPGTGIHYEQFIDRVDDLIRTLISD